MHLKDEGLLDVPQGTGGAVDQVGGGAFYVDTGFVVELDYGGAN